MCLAFLKQALLLDDEATDSMAGKGMMLTGPLL